MGEINVMEQYRGTSRPIEERARLVTEEHRAVARRFGAECFDGERLYGYGSYRYDPRFWQGTVLRLQGYYQLGEDARVLDVGCAKGFMLSDLKKLMPKASVAGLDISEYAVRHGASDICPFLCVGNAEKLPFRDKDFDLVVSITHET